LAWLLDFLDNLLSAAKHQKISGSLNLAIYMATALTIFTTSPAVADQATSKAMHWIGLVMLVSGLVIWTCHLFRVVFSNGR